ncbi:Major Facilitator Superfamily protein [Corynebacterium atrinae]|uniref:MFS transporter n=1 Tax=Corynebacterium atrinae TaxID=1336740 RepID=UPI0025B50BE8|nr:MFS transporter [Corynebacterium atrinae]WJY62896.1 Major Facilitator Superfamily protein [Corynebacterium atrinae]
MDHLEERNARRFIWSNGLQNVGDQIVAAKTVLPWLLQAAGTPGFFIALLVPIRESGSMLPQAAFTPWVLTQRSRKRIWVVGSLGQAGAAAGIGVAALALSGTALGVAVTLLFAVLAVFRAMCSIASKDVQGRTISKGRRGLITGRAAAVGGAVALAVGLFLEYLGTDIPTWVLAALIFASAGAWAVAGAVFHTIEEPENTTEPQSLADSWWTDTWLLFAQDRDFRRFVIARSLLLVTALSTAFIVTLSQEIGHGLTGLGAFLIASGLASVIGGRVSGIWSDASSRNVMAFGALIGSLLVLGLVAAAQWLPTSASAWVFPAGFFLVNLAHTAIRVARKTYIVDMAEGDQRTRYVGAANTLMGIILLLVGALSGLVALAGSSAALIFLAAIGLVGVAASLRLREVSA